MYNCIVLRFDEEAPKPQPLIPDDAVPQVGNYVQAGLNDEDVNPDLEILDQQRQLKARAREAKAARQLAKGDWAALCMLNV